MYGRVDGIDVLMDCKATIIQGYYVLTLMWAQITAISEKVCLYRVSIQRLLLDEPSPGRACHITGMYRNISILECHHDHAGKRKLPTPLSFSQGPALGSPMLLVAVWPPHYFTLRLDSHILCEANRMWSSSYLKRTYFWMPSSLPLACFFTAQSIFTQVMQESSLWRLWASEDQNVNARMAT